MSECPSLTKIFFLECFTFFKKMLENAKLHEIVRMSDGRAECHLAFEECRSALLECRMALGHAMTLMPWWADS